MTLLPPSQEHYLTYLAWELKRYSLLLLRYGFTSDVYFYDLGVDPFLLVGIPLEEVCNEKSVEALVARIRLELLFGHE